jgi:L-aminopeptidase/D-esterase-like protein
MRVEQAQAVVLTGGSAFGLASADGVMAALAAEGRGHPTPAGPVPIVPAAVIFDRMVGRPTHPGPEEGRAAYGAATDRPVAAGPTGAGAGATVAKWRGGEGVAAGLGSALVARHDVMVGALVVVNAVGDVFTLEGRSLTGGSPVPGPPGFVPVDGVNTTLALVATDAGLSRSELTRVAVRSQDAFSVCLRPAHTGFDGDMCFAVSCGSREVALIDLVAEMAFEATGRAIEAAVSSAVA